MFTGKFAKMFTGIFLMFTGKNKTLIWGLGGLYTSETEVFFCPRQQNSRGNGIELVFSFAYPSKMKKKSDSPKCSKQCLPSDSLLRIPLHYNQPKVLRLMWSFD